MMRVVFILVAVIAVLFATAVVMTRPPQPPASQAFVNGVVLTMDGEDRVAEAPDGRRRSFDLDRAVQEAAGIAGLAAAGTQAPQDDRLTPAGWRENDE